MSRLGELRRRPSALVIAVAALAALGGALGTLSSADEEPQPAARAAEPSTARPPMRVRVATVREARVERGGSVSGVIHAFRNTAISAEAAGRVVERLAEPGDAVVVDQPLLQLDATRLELALEQARANLRARRVDRSEARRELERGKSLVAGNSLSESRLDALRFAVERAESAVALAEVSLQTAQRALADSTVRAPFAGTVESVEVGVGDYLTPGRPVARLVDLSTGKLRAGVTASEAGLLAVGARTSAVFEDLGAAVLDGEVRSVGRVADPATGTYTVEVWLDNSDGRLRDGMVAQLQLPLGNEEPRPVVPRSALIRRDGRVSVFVVEDGAGGATARARPVRIGRSSGERVEILEGARVGDRVVIDGLFALRDGAPVLVEAAGS